MIEIVKTNAFQKWQTGLKDKRLQAAVYARIERLAHGYFGDAKPVKPANKGVGELRIDYGAGYRLYYTKREKEIILLLCAGDKGSQKRDIEKAIKLAEQWSGKDD